MGFGQMIVQRGCSPRRNQGKIRKKVKRGNSEGEGFIRPNLWGCSRGLNKGGKWVEKNEVSTSSKVRTTLGKGGGTLRNVHIKKAQTVFRRGQKDSSRFRKTLQEDWVSTIPGKGITNESGQKVRGGGVNAGRMTKGEANGLVRGVGGQKITKSHGDGHGKL